jgi:mRNA interferase MazF
MALTPGDVVLADFRGTQGIKRRPAVVVSTDLYNTTRPDVILGELTSVIPATLDPTDYLLQDWAAAGLHRPSLFSAYLDTQEARRVIAVIGHVTDRDWREIQARLRLGLAVT